VSHLLQAEDDPTTLNEQDANGGSAMDIEDGVLDSYMHAGQAIVLDDNGDIVDDEDEHSEK